MHPLVVLVTGAGAPGIAGTLYSVRHNYDKRPVKVVCTDSRADVVGAYMGDEFCVIPPASQEDRYLPSLLRICTNYQVDIVLPQNTSELDTLARCKDQFEEVGTRVLVSSAESIRLANNKHDIMRHCRKIDVPVGDDYLVSTFGDLLDSARELGWPGHAVVVKPPISNGSRGVRIIDERIDRKDMFYNAKPTHLYLKMDDLRVVLGETFPELLVTEYLPGHEFTVDVLRAGPHEIVIPRRRDAIRSGISFSTSTTEHGGIIAASQTLADSLDLEYCFGFQFKLDTTDVPKLLESNPRVQGSMVASTLAGANIIYSAIKHALGEEVPELTVSWGTKVLRYWGAVGINDDLVRRV